MQFLGGHLSDTDARHGHHGAHDHQGWHYPIGTLNKVVYFVKGGMEDWVYAEVGIHTESYHVNEI